MILLVSLKSSIDRTYRLPAVKRGSVIRISSYEDTAGGKAMNAARTLARLENDSYLLLGILGGFSGNWIKEQVQGEGIHSEFIIGSTPSPIDVILVETDSNQVTALFQVQPAFDRNSLRELEAAFLRHLPSAQLCILAGSSSTSGLTAFIARAIEASRKAGVEVLLDTSGAALRAGLEAGPFLVKPNREEAEELLCRPITGRDGKLRAALEIQSLGAEIVFLTDGPEDAVIAVQDTLFVAHPLRIPVLASVGGGDALIAGFSFARQAGYDIEGSIRFAIACGTLTIQDLDSSRVSATGVASIASAIRLEKIN